jgi:hypothetical protein
MNIDELTLGQIKEIQGLCGSKSTSKSHPYKIGGNYLFRTVTMIQTGRLVEVGDQELVLEDAAWIADTGRFSESLIKCEFNEVEPFPEGQVIIGRGSIIDAVLLKGNLPRSLK